MPVFNPNRFPARIVNVTPDTQLGYISGLGADSTYGVTYGDIKQLLPNTGGDCKGVGIGHGIRLTHPESETPLFFLSEDEIRKFADSDNVNTGFGSNYRPNFVQLDQDSPIRPKQLVQVPIYHNGNDTASADNIEARLGGLDIKYYNQLTDLEKAFLRKIYFKLLRGDFTGVTREEVERDLNESLLTESPVFTPQSSKVSKKRNFDTLYYITGQDNFVYSILTVGEGDDAFVCDGETVTQEGDDEFTQDTLESLALFESEEDAVDFLVDTNIDVDYYTEIRELDPYEVMGKTFIKVPINETTAGKCNVVYCGITEYIYKKLKGDKK